MTRTLFRLVLALAALGLTVLVGLWVAMGSETASAYLINRAVGLVPGAVILEDVSGRLRGTIAIGRFSYVSASTELKVSDLKVGLRWSDLLSAQVTLRELSAAHAQIVVTSAEEQPSSGLPPLPFAFALNRLSIERLHYSTEDSDETIQGIEATAKLTGRTLRVDFLEATARNLAVTVSGTARLASPFPMDLRLAWHHTVDSYAGEGRLEGDVNRLVIAHRVRSPRPLHVRGELRDLLDQLSFDLAGRWEVPAQDVGKESAALQTEGRFALAGTLEQLRAELHVAENHAEIIGSVRPAISGRFEIDAPDLSMIWTELTGHLVGSGTVTWSSTAPAMDIDVEGSGLGYRQLSACSLKLSGDLDDAGRLDASVVVSGLAADEYSIDALQGRATGTLASHRLSLRTSGAHLSIAMDSQGAWQDAGFAHVIARASATNHTFGTWNLRGPTRVTIAAGDVSVAPHCWDSAGAALCLDATERSQDRLSIAGRLRDLPLSTIAPRSVTGFQLDGRANADFELTQADSKLRGRLHWSQQDTRISYEPSGAEALTTRLEAVEANLTLDGSQARLEGRVRSDHGSTVDVSATVSEPFQRNGSIQTQVNSELQDLEEIAPLVSRFVEADELGGAVTVNLTIEGTATAPQILGTAQLSGGKAFLPAAGIGLNGVELKLVGRQGQPATLSGSARSGEGHLRVAGTLDWSELTGVSATLSVEGRDFQVVRFPEQDVAISPAMKVRIDEGLVAVAGDVAVPKADIVIERLGAAAVSTSRDTVVHGNGGESAPSDTGRLELVGELGVTLGDRVRFRGFGIDTRLAGNIRISRPSPAQATTSEGSLRTVDGRFSTYGKELKIERGLLIFSGPLDDPRIDARASRKVNYEQQTVTVGVLLSGSLSDIKSRVFSEPAMSEADALSYLVLDRPIRRADEDSSGQLSSAAVALGLSQALPVRFTRRLESSLGLDALELDGAGGDDTALVAGKHVNDDIYVKYSYGLFNRIGTLLVRYSLGGGVSIETGSGQEQTLELIYSIDR